MIDTKADVVLYYQKIFTHKMAVGTSGNISIYDPETGVMWITPSGLAADLMTETDIVSVDLNGKVLEPTRRKLSSEWRMHAAIYHEMPDIRAIVHTHSPYATAFRALNRSIPLVLMEMNAFTNGAVPVSPYAPNGSEALAANVVTTMMGCHTCLMENHGAVAAGRDLSEAFIRASYIEEDAAKVSRVSWHV